ncbi:hypothetical protein CBR_g289 [Chara braunii]|uniref:Uncharacterized protein n=1 Tax=Chara braunii TaxID=69332 RepID=A0A388JQ64_CHABU|nr:hypothetical protein CBR_g289 [Chara braunii]|eukprot:GBG59956.1 hypothetical protein CBR_g289 [Chara braunii]
MDAPSPVQSIVVLMAQLGDYLHIAVPAPLMDARVEVVDLHDYAAKIDREFKSQTTQAQTCAFRVEVVNLHDIDAPLGVHAAEGWLANSGSICKGVTSALRRAVAILDGANVSMDHNFEQQNRHLGDIRQASSGGGNMSGVSVDPGHAAPSRGSECGNNQPTVVSGAHGATADFKVASKQGRTEVGQVGVVHPVSARQLNKQTLLALELFVSSPVSSILQEEESPNDHVLGADAADHKSLIKKFGTALCNGFVDASLLAESAAGRTGLGSAAALSGELTAVTKGAGSDGVQVFKGVFDDDFDMDARSGGPSTTKAVWTSVDDHQTDLWDVNGDETSAAGTSMSWACSPSSRASGSSEIRTFCIRMIVALGQLCPEAAANDLARLLSQEKNNEVSWMSFLTKALQCLHLIPIDFHISTFKAYPGGRLNGCTSCRFLGMSLLSI